MVNFLGFFSEFNVAKFCASVIKKNRMIQVCSNISNITSFPIVCMKSYLQVTSSYTIVVLDSPGNGEGRVLKKALSVAKSCTLLRKHVETGILPCKARN